MCQTFVVSTLCWMATTAHAQEYQKAKDILRATSNASIFLYLEASTNSVKVTQVPRGASVLIYGKKGSFLDILYLNKRGYGPISTFDVVGVATSPSRVQSAESTPRREPPPMDQSFSRARNQRRESSHLPIRLNPYLTYVAKGKSFDNQVRLGFEGTFDLSDTVSLGGVLDFVFIKGTYVDIGPIIKRRWGSPSGFFNPAVSVGLLYYKFDHDQDADEGIGFQWALENDATLITSRSFQPAISVKIGADMMYFNFDQVRIPFWISVGGVFRF